VDDKPVRRRHGRPLLIALLFFDLIILYVLSYGPAFWLFRRGWLSGETCQILYAPVDVVYEQAPRSVQESMDWYVELWDRRPGRRGGRR
jgi:hypothetical protein